MLTSLRIKDFAIVEDMEVELTEGLNVITGETGAGKSILLKAISLLSGARAKTDSIRRGKNQSIIEGVFQLEADSLEKLHAVNDEMSTLVPDEELIIKRVLDTKGKGQVFINGSRVTASTLTEVATSLIDITGQHQQQSLLNSKAHLAMLDSFGVSPKLLEENARLFKTYAVAAKKLEQFLSDQDSIRQRYEAISAEHLEITEANLQVGEREEIENSIARAANIETLGSQASEALDLLSEDSPSVEDMLRKISALVDNCFELDESLGEAKELLDNSVLQLEEFRFSLSEYSSKLELEPETLEGWRARLAEIAALSRRYRRDESELIAYSQSLQKEISELEEFGFDEAKLKENVSAARTALDASEQKLSAARKKVAKQLEKGVKSSLEELGMKGASFSVELAQCESNLYGRESVEFFLAANVGEGSKPLAKVASGGELSRVLLILKTLLSNSKQKNALSPSTQIFDEIDSGIGGSVARLVGEKLKAVSKLSQVILITHSPQIASLADNHLLVEKASVNKRTSSAISQLEFEQRVETIASMMGGVPGSKEFEASARELLKPRSFS